MLMCDQLVSFDDFKVLASSNSEFHLKIKESLLISCDQSILNKNEASLPSLYLFDQLHKHFTVLYDYLVSSFVHCYLHYVIFSNKIYALVNFKIVLKIVDKKNLVKREYGLKMCTMQYTKRVAKYTKTWICQHNVFHINLIF